MTIVTLPMKTIGRYKLTVHTLDKPELVHDMSWMPEWSEHLEEAAENLTDLLPVGYYVRITEERSIDDGAA